MKKFLCSLWQTRRKLLLLILVVTVAGAFYALRYREATPATNNAGVKPSAGRPLPPVLTAAAHVQDLSVWVTGLGTVTSMATITIQSRVDGQLMKIYFHEGQIVKAGDLLAEIDPRPYQVQLEQAQGQKARDEALLKNARLDVERYKTLAAQNAIPQQQLDTQVSLVDQYVASVFSDQSQVDNARLQLTYCRITAPVSGRLGLRQVDPGNIIQANATTGIVVLTQLSPITVIFPLPQDNLPAIIKKMKEVKAMEVEAWDRANANRLASGSLIALDNLVDPTTGMVKLRAHFTNQDGSLFPNQFVNARMHLDTIKNAIVIPTSGVQQGSNGPYAYVVNDQQVVSVRKLIIGQKDGNLIAIREGLTAGDMVVVDGVDNLREGATVTVTNRSSATPPAPATPEHKRPAP